MIVDYQKSRIRWLDQTLKLVLLLLKLSRRVKQVSVIWNLWNTLIEPQERTLNHNCQLNQCQNIEEFQVVTHHIALKLLYDHGCCKLLSIKRKQKLRKTRDRTNTFIKEIAVGNIGGPGWASHVFEKLNRSKDIAHSS